jgi:hypothetical protein
LKTRSNLRLIVLAKEQRAPADHKASQLTAAGAFIAYFASRLTNQAGT